MKNYAVGMTILAALLSIALVVVTLGTNGEPILQRVDTEVSREQATETVQETRAPIHPGEVRVKQLPPIVKCPKCPDVEVNLSSVEAKLDTLLDAELGDLCERANTLKTLTACFARLGITQGQ